MHQMRSSAYLLLVSGVAHAAEPADPLHLGPAEPAEEVLIDAERESVGSRSGESLLAIPATVNRVPERVLRQRNQVTLTSALENVPGVNPVLQYGGFSYLTLRGFNEFVVIDDGGRDDRYFYVESAPTPDLVGVSSVEVLKGPAAALYGFGGLGGVVQLRYAEPTAVPQQEASVTLGGPRWQRRARLSASGPLEPASELAYRLDVGVGADEDFRRARRESTTVSGQLAWRPRPAHRLSLRAHYARALFGTDTGLPTEGGRVPSGIARDRRFNTAFDRLKTEEVGVRLSYQATLEEGLAVWSTLRAAHNPYVYQSAETLSVTSDQTVSRDWFFLQRTWIPLAAAVGARLEGTWLVPHQAAVIYELGLLFSQHPRADLSNTTLAQVSFERLPDPQPEWGVLRTNRHEWNQRTHSLSVHDTVTLLPALRLAVGARADSYVLDRIDQTIDPRSLEPIAQTDRQRRETTALTGRAGLVLQPSPSWTWYASVGNGFRPLLVVPSDGRQLEPERGRQFELGSRFSERASGLLLHLAAYDLRKVDVAVPRGEGEYDQAGAQRSRGVEVEAELPARSATSLRLGYAYTRARYEQYATADASFDGKIPPNVPDHTLTSWLTQQVLPSLTFGFGARWVGKSFADPANLVELPGYVTLDGSLIYLQEPFEAALSITNLTNTDHHFVASINGSQLTPGAPTTALATVRFVR